MNRITGTVLFLILIALPVGLAGAIVSYAERGGTGRRLVASLGVLIVSGSVVFMGYQLLFAGVDGITFPVAGVAAMVVGSLIGIVGLFSCLVSESPKLPGDPVWEAEARKRRVRQISRLEKELRKSPQDTRSLSKLSSLSDLYSAEKQFSKMEQAIKRHNELTLSLLGFEHSWNYVVLGGIYLAALSTSMRGTGIPIYGYKPYGDNLTPAELGYTTEQVQSLAVKHLTKAYELMRQEDFSKENNRVLEGVELARKVALDPSPKAFEEYVVWKKKQVVSDV